MALLASQRTGLKRLAMGYLVVGLWHLARLPVVNATSSTCKPLFRDVQHCLKEHAWYPPREI